MIMMSAKTSEGFSTSEKPERRKESITKKRNNSRRLKFLSRSELWSVI